ncbi:MAG: redoxin domain-containing protein [Gammaproteobacteria bacterium]
MNTTQWISGVAPTCQLRAAILATTFGLTLVLPTWAEEQPAPEYGARALGGSAKVSLASLRGQVVLLNTWATWCSPCRQEMPAFETLYRRYRARGLTVVGVNIDEGQADEPVQRYVEGIGVSFPIWRDPQNRIAKRFRVLGVPETFLLNREGMILRHWRGRMDPNVPEDLKSIQDALGPQGATMAAGVQAEAPAAQGEPTPKRGRRLAEQRGCLTCHATDGAPGVGPSWKDLAGSEAKLADGRKLMRDRDYLARAIVDPDAEIVAGYAKGVMAGAMPGQPLTEAEVEALILYLTSLSTISPAADR